MPAKDLAKKPEPGDPVRLSARDATPADVKSGLFYPYFRGLTGIYDRLYKDGTALVLVNIASLPDDARRRHDKSLRYSILVSPDDLAYAPDAAPALPDTDAPARPSLSDLEDAEARHLEERTGGTA